MCRPSRDRARSLAPSGASQQHTYPAPRWEPLLLHPVPALLQPVLMQGLSHKLFHVFDKGGGPTRESEGPIASSLPARSFPVFASELPPEPRPGTRAGTAQPGNGSRGQLRREKGRWQAQQESVAQPCPLLASHLAFLNLFPRDKMGTLITSSCCKKQVNCKMLPKMCGASKQQGPASHQGSGSFGWTQAPLRDSVPPQKGGPGQKEATVR